MSGARPMISCAGCGTRRRTVALWNTNRRGKPPALHLGLPDRWRVFVGLPFCPNCSEREERTRAFRDARPRGRP